jgi:hypothetical protein
MELVLDDISMSFFVLVSAFRYALELVRLCFPFPGSLVFPSVRLLIILEHESYINPPRSYTTLLSCTPASAAFHLSNEGAMIDDLPLLLGIKKKLSGPIDVCRHSALAPAHLIRASSSALVYLPLAMMVMVIYTTVVDRALFFKTAMLCLGGYIKPHLLPLLPLPFCTPVTVNSY